MVECLRAAVESTGRRDSAVRRAPPARRRAAARRLDRLRRHEARARARAWSVASLRRRPRGTLHQRRRDHGRRPARASSTTSRRTGSTLNRSRSWSRARPRSAGKRAARSSGARRPSSRHVPRRRARLRGHVRRAVSKEGLIDSRVMEAGDAIVGFPSAGVHANGFTLVRGCSRRGLRRRRPARTDAPLPRGHPSLARAHGRPRARPCDGRRHRRQPRARRSRRPQGRDRLERVEATAGVRAGLPATWTRRSSGACSTSESGISRSSRIRRDDLVVGRIVGA